MEPKTRYAAQCVINYDRYEIEIPSIWHAKEGFWVNGDVVFTQGEDAQYWIPPSSIEYVEKTRA